MTDRSAYLIVTGCDAQMNALGNSPSGRRTLVAKTGLGGFVHRRFILPSAVRVAVS
jgi:hypothetical protein